MRVAARVAGKSRAGVLSCAIDMSMARLLLAALAGGFASSMTDWFFNSDWLYKRYDRHPEIWRFSGQGESKAVMWASLLPLLTCAAFALACQWLHLHSLVGTLKMAVVVWLMAPLPLTIANALFVKVSPAIAVSHALSWLVKLALAAIAVSLIAG
jgi:hypothetical protein